MVPGASWVGTEVHAITRTGPEAGVVPRPAMLVTTEAAGRPRILHVITHLDMGGAEGVAMGLIDALRPQIDFSLFAVLRHPELGAVGREMKMHLDSWQVPYNFGVRGRFKSGGVVIAALALVRALKRFRADAVHLHTEVPELTFAVACTLSRYARRLPLLRTVHNMTLWIDWPRLGGWVTERLAHGEAVAVSCHAADADAAIRTGRRRIRPDVIYNGVHRPERQILPLGLGPFRLLFAGRLVHQKGADLLPAILEAAYRRSGRRDVEVTIAGNGVLRDEVGRGLAGRLDGWTVQIVPPIERLAEQIGAFDAVLLPSRYEGFGLLALETLLAGVPLVTTDAPGLDEVIPRDYPLKAPVDDVDQLGDLLAAVIRGEGHHRAIAAYGDGLATRFSPKVMAAAYAERYRALAARGQSMRA